MFFIHYKGFHLLMHIIEGKILLILQLLKNLRRAEAKLAKKNTKEPKILAVVCSRRPLPGVSLDPKA